MEDDLEGMEVPEPQRLLAQLNQQLRMPQQKHDIKATNLGADCAQLNWQVSFKDMEVP